MGQMHSSARSASAALFSKRSRDSASEESKNEIQLTALRNELTKLQAALKTVMDTHEAMSKLTGLNSEMAEKVAQCMSRTPSIMNEGTRKIEELKLQIRDLMQQQQHKSPLRLETMSLASV